MSEQSHDAAPASFYEVLRKALKKRKTNVERICPLADSVAATSYLETKPRAKREEQT